MTDWSDRPALPAQGFLALLLAIFVVAFGYGVLLPNLPSLMRQMTSSASAEAISRDTGLSSSAYALALFLLAPRWGRITDRYGRRRILILGLGGFATVLALSSAAASITAFYLSRFLSGAFAAAIAPAGYGLVGDTASSEEQRAHRFAFLTVANSLGFLAGPIAGGFVIPVARVVLPNAAESFATRMPFLASAALATLVAGLVYLLIIPDRKETQVSGETALVRSGNYKPKILARLLLVSFMSATALGVLEIGLSLLGAQTMGMSPDRIGYMFAECMVVMLLVQAVIFSPLVKIDSTRWVFAPCLASVAATLALLPFARSYIAMSAAVAAVAAGAGAVAPVVTYWISRNSGDRQGSGLGLDMAAQNLGQATGAAAVGLLFAATLVPNAAFTLSALLILAASTVSIGLPRLLLPRLL